MNTFQNFCGRLIVGPVLFILVIFLTSLDLRSETWKSSGEPARLRLELIEQVNDISKIRVLMLDDQGVICDDKDDFVRIGLTGDGTIIDHQGTANKSGTLQLDEGRAHIMVIMNKGRSVVSVSYEELKTVFLKLTSTNEDKKQIQPPKLGILEMFAKPARDEVIDVMNSVADWQLGNLPEPKKRGGKGLPWYVHNDWTNAAFYTGVMAHWKTTGNRKYLDQMISFAEEVEWKPGPRLLHADDHVIGQVYAEIYMHEKDEKMIKPILERMEEVMEDPISGRELWWWCDALYMAPPTLTRLYEITGDRKYLDFMDEKWWDATDFLYDEDERLYYRDHRFIIQPDGSGRREASGDKVFWSRGNGWVLAGIARVLQYMPEDYPQLHKYEQLFREMAGRIAELQGTDGLWRTSLLHPQGHGESSGTGFYVYALAWGINEGLLEEDVYMPYALRGWYGLNRLVQPDGKLGWTQRIGYAPDEIHEDMSEVYGAGAFLLAGSEIIKF